MAKVNRDVALFTKDWHRLRQQKQRRRGGTEARMLLAELLEESWGAVDVDAIVTSAVNQLDSRRLEAEYRDLSRRLPLAADEEKPVLASRVQDLGRQIAKLNPGRLNVIRKGGRVGS